MDLLSVGGIFIGLSAVVGGNLLEGGNILALCNGPALVIVLGGSIGSVLLQTPFSSIKNLWPMLKWIFSPPIFDTRSNIEKILQWSRISRKEGLLALDALMESEENKFVKKGLQLLIDGSQSDQVRSLLEIDNHTTETRYFYTIGILESMGGYAPTMGIVGAVMGLVHVMGNLTNPASVGPGIATAFVATIYGVGFANLIFFPLATKLKSVVNDIMQQRELLVEGVIAIAEGEHPTHIEMRLMCYMAQDNKTPIAAKRDKTPEAAKSQPEITIEKIE